MGIGSKCVSEDFQELSFSDFQAFLRRGCTSFNPFLSNLDNSPHLTVFYSRFLLDAFTHTEINVFISVWDGGWRPNRPSKVLVMDPGIVIAAVMYKYSELVYKQYMHV